MYFRRGNRVATTLLGMLVLIFAFNIADEFVEAAGFIDELPHFLLATFTLPLMIGPLLFIYGQYLSQSRKRIRTKDWLHFLPFALATIYFSPFYLLSGNEKLEAIRQGILSDEIVLFASIKGVHLLIYFGVILYAIHKSMRQKSLLSRAQHVKVIWYKWLILALLIVWLITGALYYAPFLSDKEIWDSDYVAALLQTIVIYTYAFLAITYPGSLDHAVAPAIVQSEPETSDSIHHRYRTSPIDAQQKKYYLNLLLDHMEAEQPYLNAELSREDIARQFSISAHNVSQIINEELGVNFYEFVNRYRVDEVKRKLDAGEQAQKTLLAIAFEAGFKSKSSFNRVFKQHAGMTPTQFLSGLQ